MDGTVVVVCVDDSHLLFVNNISQPTEKTPILFEVK